MATDFLLLDGARIRLTQFNERPPVLVGEVVRAFAGNPRTTVRDFRRVWSGTMAGLDVSAARGIKNKLAIGRAITVTGDSLNGDSVRCLPRMAGSRYVHDKRATNPTQFVEEVSLELEEIDAPPYVALVETDPTTADLTAFVSTDVRSVVTDDDNIVLSL